MILGVTFDSLVLGGTIIFYNKTSEENFPLKGILRWLIICIEFFALQYAWQFFFPSNFDQSLAEKIMAFVRIPCVLLSVKIPLQSNWAHKRKSDLLRHRRKME